MVHAVKIVNVGAGIHIRECADVRAVAFRRGRFCIGEHFSLRNGGIVIHGFAEIMLLVGRDSRILNVGCGIVPGGAQIFIRAVGFLEVKRKLALYRIAIALTALFFSVEEEKSVVPFRGVACCGEASDDAIGIGKRYQRPPKLA